jgi:hypothetical protein
MAGGGGGEGAVQGLEKGMGVKGMQVEARDVAGTDAIKAGSGGSNTEEAPGDSVARSRAAAGKRKG